MFMRNFMLAIAMICQVSVWSIDIQTFEKIKTLFSLYGNDKYMINEEIIQRSHVLQAALLANLSGAPEDVVIALMMHDIGQIASKEHVGNLDYLHAKHDELGAEWLKMHSFPPFVCDVVRYHTIAKVVLCMEDPNYFANLSLASKESYFIQRDKYLNEENKVTLQTFLAHPRCEDIKHARKCDDMAKIVGLDELSENNPTGKLPSFDTYYDMTVRVCDQTSKSVSNQTWHEAVNELYSFMVEDRQAFEGFIKAKF